MVMWPDIGFFFPFLFFNTVAKSCSPVPIRPSPVRGRSVISPRGTTECLTRGLDRSARARLTRALHGSVSWKHKRLVGVLNKRVIQLNWEFHRLKLCDMIDFEFGFIHTWKMKTVIHFDPLGCGEITSIWLRKLKLDETTYLMWWPWPAEL